MEAAWVLRRARARWVASGKPDYALWIPVVTNGFALAAAAAAAVQRIPTGDALPATGLMAVAVTPWVIGLLGSKPPWPVFTVMTVGAVSTLMWLYPVDLDFALLVLMIMAGHVGAVESMRDSALATAVAAAAIVALDVTHAYDGSAFWLAGIVIGWDIGWILQSQQRRLDEQQRQQAERETRAVLQERQRIAREVHDVVAHSLSVTMLHLTAARRDLQDGGEVAEVIEALQDAERVGRQAMNDIRQTVGLLGQETGAATAAPDLSDVPALVQQFRGAGLDVRYETAGDGATLTAAERTGLYRIVQESLANVAKHEPRASAVVTLDLASDPARLVVRNTLSRPVGTTTGGSGLRGMSERARHLGASFTAGPAGDGWQVLVELGNPHARGCPLPLLRDLRGTTPETA